MPRSKEPIANMGIRGFPDKYDSWESSVISFPENNVTKMIIGKVIKSVYLNTELMR